MKPRLTLQSAWYDCGWLEWYYAENDMGAGKKQAGYDGQLITIGSLEDLYRLIELSRERMPA